MPTCLRLLVQFASCAFFFALANAGNSNAARMAMIAMTTSNSIRVKASDFFEVFCMRLLQARLFQQISRRFTSTVRFTGGGGSVETGSRPSFCGFLAILQSTRICVGEGARMAKSEEKAE